MKHFAVPTLGLIGALAMPSVASAQAEQCEVAEPMTGQRLLRRMSLDLRDIVPSGPEIDAMGDAAEVDDTMLDDMIQSERFVSMMRRYHSSLLWPNIEQIELVAQTHQLAAFEIEPGVQMYLSPLRAVFTRAAPNAQNLYLPCKNEPATFDAEGRPIAEPLMMGSEIIGYQEGYVEVVPYWPVTDAEGNVIPGATVRVCALDAQDTLTGRVCPGPEARYPFLEPTCQNIENISGQPQFGLPPFRGSEVDCSGPMATFSPDCGCGPNLRFCTTPQTEATIRASMMEQELRIVDTVIRDGRPYHEILTERTVDFNGPLAHYIENMARLDLNLYADDETALPPAGMSYTDTWRSVERTGIHSGVLTTPGYLLRFNSNRGRAHRFYNAFECSSFIPNGPLPSPFEECSQHENLRLRCGCNACHEGLEPMAMHWGRFSPFGYGHIDPARFPAVVGESCTAPFDSIEQLFRCTRFYELEPVGEEAEYFGYLNAYVFTEPEEAESIETGPSKLARESVESGRFGACAAERMWEHFMRREPTPKERDEVMPALLAELETNDYDLRALVRAIVQHPAYRRLP